VTALIMTFQLNIWASAVLFEIHCRDSSISCSWCSNEVFCTEATLSKLSRLPRSRLVSLASLVCRSVGVSYLTADLHSPKYKLAKVKGGYQLFPIRDRHDRLSSLSHSN